MRVKTMKGRQGLLNKTECLRVKKTERQEDDKETNNPEREEKTKSLPGVLRVHFHSCCLMKSITGQGRRQAHKEERKQRKQTLCQKLAWCFPLSCICSLCSRYVSPNQYMPMHRAIIFFLSPSLFCFPFFLFHFSIPFSVSRLRDTLTSLPQFCSFSVYRVIYIKVLI